MNDARVVMTVLIALAVLSTLTVAGGIYLTAIDKTLPGELIAIGSAAAGAIAGILSRTNTVHDPTPQAVTVVNPPAAPVPVEAA